MLDSVQERANAVDTQLRTNDVTDPRLIRAILSVARERYVPKALVPVAYMDGCIALAKGRVLLDLRAFGKLAQLAQIAATDRVLDIGCGTGYSTAVFSHLAGHVVGLEQDRELARKAAEALAGTANAEIVEAAFTEGLPAKRPFNVVFLNGSVERTPENLIEQLADEGRLVCFVRNGAAGHARIYLKHGAAFGERDAFDAIVPVLPGFEQQRSFAL
jgi:protein-L-isoaspartate(D-aspartate) O-methyltransferase